MQEYVKHIAWWMLLFEENLQEKASVYILKQCQDTGQCCKESLQGDNVVKNLEMVWTKKKTIEFSFHMLERIMQISAPVIVILQIILSLIQ